MTIIILSQRVPFGVASRTSYRKQGCRKLARPGQLIGNYRLEFGQLQKNLVSYRFLLITSPSSHSWWWCWCPSTSTSGSSRINVMASSIKYKPTTKSSGGIICQYTCTFSYIFAIFLHFKGISFIYGLWSFFKPTQDCLAKTMTTRVFNPFNKVWSLVHQLSEHAIPFLSFHVIFHLLHLLPPPPFSLFIFCSNLPHQYKSNFIPIPIWASQGSL